MRKTYWVTFLTQGGNSLIRVRNEDPSEPCTYRVEIENKNTVDPKILLSQAINHAKIQHTAWLESQKSESDAIDPEEKRSDEVTHVFSAKEIEPYLDEMLARMVAVAQTGIHLVLTTAGTASTDCRQDVQLNPEPFLFGRIEAGMGRGMHETGHIRYDQHGTTQDLPRRSNEQAYGTALLSQANADGGEVLAHILNLVMDRRSDDLGAKEFPGNANALYRRLGDLLPGEYKNPTGKIVRTVNGRSLACETSVFVDFTYAIKKRTRAKHAIVCKCVNLALRAIRRVNQNKRRYVHLLTASKEILELLRQHMTEQEKVEQTEQETFRVFMVKLNQTIHGKHVDPKFADAFREFMCQKLAKQRRKELSSLASKIRSMPFGARGIGASAGEPQHIVRVDRNPQAYLDIVRKVGHESRRIREIVRRLSVPEVRVQRDLIHGELDLDALSRLVTGGSDCMKIDLHQRRLDAAIAFLLDFSASMASHRSSLELGVSFNEGLIPFHRLIDSRYFAFNERVYDCGVAQPNNGIAGVNCDGGTLEHFGVRVAGNWLRQSRRSRRLLLTICDGAPSDIKKTKEEAYALLSAGILPIRILVGVHVAPKTYPIELFFDTWDELFTELAHVFETVVRAVRIA